MNDALTLPFFTAQGSSYPPTPPFGDSYDSTYTNSQDEFYTHGYDLDSHDDPTSGLILNPIPNLDHHQSRSNGLGSYPFPTPPASSHTTGPTYSQPPTTFNPSDASSSYMSGLFTDPASYLDVDITRPQFTNAEAGPSTYSRQSSATDEYLNQPDDDDDEEEEEADDPLVKYEDRPRATTGDVVEAEYEDGAEGVEEQAGDDNEEPLYVNAKQYHRILKRRAARQRLEELNRLARSRKPYLHESRHRHACSRPRGKGGRFLTAEEIEALKKEEAAKSGGSIGDGTSDFSHPSTVA